MNICIIAKDNIEKCPPLLRMVTSFVSKGDSFDIFCLGKENAFPNLSPQPIDMRNLHIYRIKEAQGIFKKARPLSEVPRLALTLKKVDKGDWDVVIAYEPYALFTAMLAGLGNKQPLIYYSAELYDESRFWPQRLMEDLSKSSVAAIITCQKDRERLLINRLGINPKTIVVPNACFDYYPQFENKKKTSIVPPVYFIYQGGNQIRKRCLYPVIDVIGNIAADVRLKMALAGPESDMQRIRLRMAKTKYPERFEFLNYVQYPEHFYSAYCCHVGIMLYNPSISNNYKYCAPNKLYEYTMLGLAVLASNQEHLKKDIENNGFGICVDPDKEQLIAGAVLELCKPDILATMQHKSRKWYEKQGRYEIISTDLRHWCSEMCNCSTIK